MMGHQSKSTKTAKNHTLGGFCVTCGGTGRTETGCQPCPICKTSIVPDGQRIGNGVLHDMHNDNETKRPDWDKRPLRPWYYESDERRAVAEGRASWINPVTSEQETAERLASEAVNKIQRFIGTTDEKAEQMHKAILVAIYEGQLATLASVRESIK